jgi:hypothetical protein
MHLININKFKFWFIDNWKYLLSVFACVLIWLLIKENILSLSYPKWGLSFGDGSTDSPFSVSAWIYMHDASVFVVASKADSTNLEWYVGCDSGDRFVCFLYDADGSNRISKRSAVGYMTAFENTWVHVAATYSGNGSSTGINIYVNGSNVNSDTNNAGSYTAMHNFSVNAYIGYREFVANYSDGLIEELYVVGAELTSLEVGSLYNPRMRGMPYQVQWLNRKVYCPMDNGKDGVSADGDTIIDRSGNGNNGTGDDGAGNSGLTWIAGNNLSYPGDVNYIFSEQPIVGAIMNQFQGPNLGADLLNGTLM